MLFFHFLLSFGDGWPLSTLLVGKVYLVVPRMIGMYVITNRMFYIQCVLFVSVVVREIDTDTRNVTCFKPEPFLKQCNGIVCAESCFCFLFFLCCGFIFV